MSGLPVSRSLVGGRQWVAGAIGDSPSDGNLYGRQDGNWVEVPSGGSAPVTLTGDVTGTGTGTIPTVLATVMASPGTYNNITVNAKGLATAGANAAYLTGNQTITATGDATGSGTTTLPLTLATVNANVGTFNNLTVNGKGQVTAASNAAYLTSSGVSGMTAGQIPIAASATTITSSGNLSGDVTTSTGSLATTLATVNANVGTFQGITVNAKGLVTAAANQGYLTSASAATTYLPLVGGTISGSPGSLVIGTPPGGSLGVGTLNTSGVMQVNGNAAAFVNPIAGNTLQLQQANASGHNIQMNAFAAASNIIAARSENTAASPAALGSAANILALSARGYDGSAWSTSAAAMALSSINGWTTGDHSTQVVFQTVPTGSTAAATVATLKNSGCQIQGTTINDNAPAGNYGEYGSSIINAGGAVSLTGTGTVHNITSITPSAGDYMFWGEVWILANAATITVGQGSISTTSATATLVPADAGGTFNIGWNGTPTPLILALAPIRISTTGATTVYLMAAANFSAGGPPSAYGKLAWRRMR
jgi:hypothetical protein